MNQTVSISDAIVQAFGWTLVHSLWQGALAALVLLALLSRLQTAKSRYWSAFGVLTAIFAAAVVTFCRVYQPATTSVEGIATLDFPFSEQGWTDIASADEGNLELVSGWLEEHHPLIVAVWLLGFGFFLLRFAGGLWYVNRLSKRGTIPVTDEWDQKTAALAGRLGISKTVRLLESALVHAPVAIGWLKPIILLPVGLVNRLSPAEVEAILAHELAHIARRDWIFNLAQAFIETLFYYHPAVWWISSVVRNERENCCDDTALAATGNRIAFAKALVQVQEMAKPASALALGINGSGRPLLLERIRRILNQPQQKSQIMEKLTATIILFALLALVGIRANNTSSLSAAFAQMSGFPTAFFDAPDAEDQVDTDSVPKPKNIRKITREDDNQRVEAEYQDNKLTRLNIDGKEIPASEFEQHRDLTNELRRELRAPAAPIPPMPPGIFFFPPESPATAPTPPAPPMPPMPPRVSTTKDDDGNTIIMLEHNGEPMEIKVKDGQVYVNGDQLEEGESLDLPGLGNGYYFWNGEDGNSYHFTPEAGYHFEGLNLEGLEGLESLEGLQYIENLDEFPHFKLSEEDRERLEEERARIMSEADRIRSEHRQIIVERQRLQEEEMEMAQEEVKERRKEMQKEQKRWQKEQKQWAKEQEKWGEEQERFAREHSRMAVEQAKSQSMGKSLKKQLMKDGLISDPGNFTFELSSKELKVNGVKQSDALHRKYIELYQAQSGKSLGKNGNFMWTESN